MTARWNLTTVLHETVVRATRRMSDQGLAARVLADEGRRITDDAQRRANTIVTGLTWRDLWGSLHCWHCGGLMPGERGVDRPCSCPREVVAA